MKDQKIRDINIQMMFIVNFISVNHYFIMKYSLIISVLNIEQYSVTSDENNFHQNDIFHDKNTMLFPDHDILIW